MGEDDFIIMFSVRIYDVVRIPKYIRENAIKPFEALSLFRGRGILVPISELLHQIANAYLIACQCCVKQLSFLPFDLVVWCGCSAAILYHILEAMSRALSVFFGDVTPVLQAVANNSMSKMGGLSSIRPPQVGFDR